MTKIDEIMKGVKEFPTYDENPYVHNLIVPSRNKTIAMSNKQLSLFDREGVEVENINFMGLRKRVDTEEFVKIYKAQIQALFELSNRAIKVFGYFMDALRISKDLVVFDLKECKRYTGYSSKESVTRGVAELLEKQFIARTDVHYKYYINPAKFFNGDRLVLFEDVVKKGSPTDREMLRREELEKSTITTEYIKDED